MPRKPIIRKTTTRDFIAINKLLKTTKLVGNYFDTKLFGKLLKRNKGFCFVAEHDGKVVGSVFASHDGGYCGYISILP